jgi:hypothetical protein
MMLKYVKCCDVKITVKMELFIALSAGGAKFVTQKKGDRKNEETGFLKHRTFGPYDGTIILDFP